MEHKGVEYTVVQLAGGAGWKWEVRFGDGKKCLLADPRTGKPYGLPRNLLRSGRYANRGPDKVSGRLKSASAASSRASR